MIQQFPAAIAPTSGINTRDMGKFQGAIIVTTPFGSCTRKAAPSGQTRGGTDAASG